MFFFHPRNWLGSLGLCLLILIAWLPMRAQKACACIFGWLARHTLRRFSRICQTNLAICLPELDARQKQQLVRRSYRYMFWGMVRLIALGFVPKKRILKTRHLHNTRHIQQALDSNKSVFLIGCHQSFFTTVLTLGDTYPLIMTYKKTGNLLWDRAIVHRATSPYVEQLYDSNSLRSIAKSFSRPRVYWIAADMDLKGRGSIFSPFFGRSASTVTSIARFSKMTDSIIVPLSIVLEKDNSFHIYFSDPIKTHSQQNIQQTVDIINCALEKEIRKYPEQYLWMIHPRFKTQPSGTASPYE